MLASILCTISESRLLFHIDAWRRQREFERQQGDDSSLLLQDLQARLIHDQDLYLSHASRNIYNTQPRPLTSNWRQVPPRGPYPQSSATHTSSDPARRLTQQRHGNIRPNNRSSQRTPRGNPSPPMINRDQRSPYPSNQRDGLSCWGCGGPHNLSNCPTTSDSNKCAIYNQQLSSYNSCHSHLTKRNTSSSFRPPNNHMTHQQPRSNINSLRPTNTSNSHAAPALHLNLITHLHHPLVPMGQVPLGPQLPMPLKLNLE